MVCERIVVFSLYHTQRRPDPGNMEAHAGTGVGISATLIIRRKYSRLGLLQTYKGTTY